MSFIAVPPWSGEEGYDDWIQNPNFALIPDETGGAAPGHVEATDASSTSSFFTKKLNRVKGVKDTSKQGGDVIHLEAKSGVNTQVPSKTATKKKRKRKSRKKKTAGDAVASGADHDVAAKHVPDAAGLHQKAPPQKKRNLKKQEAEDVLLGAKFRMLNEQLYSVRSEEAVELFDQHKELFSIYHKGFALQVEKWPSHPLDGFIAWLGKQDPSLVVADLGAGEARLSASVRNKVHSFDLVAANDRVVACDIAHVPLPDSSVDVAIFCLSLMGTNWQQFIREAHRILRKKGHLKIAEVASRIQNAKGFGHALCSLGFNLISVDETNSHFTVFALTKSNVPPSKKDADAALGICKYKKR